MKNSEQQYRQEWAGKTGRPASEVYVPRALRETLRAGDRIRILVDGLSSADVWAGDILRVDQVEGGGFKTEAPTVTYSPHARWEFGLSDEGTGWERVW